MRISGDRIKRWQPGDILSFRDHPRRRFRIVGSQKGPYVRDPAVIFERKRGEWNFYSSCPPEDIGLEFDLIGFKDDDFFWAGQGPVTGRPYVMFKRAAGVVLRAGCRSFTTYAQAARHWRDNGFSDCPREKRAIAKAAFAEARRRGWLKVKRQPPVKKRRG